MVKGKAKTVLGKIAETDYEVMVGLSDVQLYQVKNQINTGDLVSIACGDTQSDKIKELFSYQGMKPDFLVDVIIAVRKVD
jgi:hypothetical protein